MSQQEADAEPAELEPIVTMRGVTKSFGDLVVLDDLDLDVAPNTRLSIIGPSGSGKSTLLRVLMALEPINAGRIEIEGTSLWTVERGGQEVKADDKHLRAMRRRMGMVFQRFNLFPHMTVVGNLIEAPVHVLGMSKADATERAMELLAMVGLEDFKDRYPAQLSGGQQQRVAIARALAMRPRVMLFDEITSALDPELVGDVLDVLRRLAGEGDMTMLLVTHQMDFARDFSDRVLFMEGGHIVEDGPPQQVFVEPTEARTREFLQAVLEAR